jgi:hypothetical protein
MGEKEIGGGNEKERKPTEEREVDAVKLSQGERERCEAKMNDEEK